MKRALKYIELKSGYSDDGPAWIGYVGLSKTGKTIYYDDKAFIGNGHGGCTDIETGELYWVTGVKKNGQNRHICGAGAIQIDENAIKEYESITGINVRQNQNFKIYQSKPINKQRFEKLLNEKL